MNQTLADFVQSGGWLTPDGLVARAVVRETAEQHHPEDPRKKDVQARYDPNTELEIMAKDTPKVVKKDDQYDHHPIDIEKGMFLIGDTRKTCSRAHIFHVYKDHSHDLTKAQS